MSTIIDALKKTQSAIDKKPYTDRTIYGDIEIPNSGRQDAKSQASLLGQKKIPGFSIGKFKNFFSFLNRRHLIGTTLILCLCGGIWLGYQYDSQIIHDIIHATSAITNDIKIHAHTNTTEIAATKPQKLILNGTVRAGAKHDAMINNHLYRVGDRVNENRILEIRYDQVTLLDTETKKTTVLTTELS